MPDDLTITTRRRIDDAGEKIGGARKDAWAQRGLATSDLAEMTPEEARQHVTKDAIWPKPDWSAMVADGLDPQAAALMKIVRDRLGAKPALNVYQIGSRALRDAGKIYADYVAMMTIVRDAIMSCRTPADVQGAHRAIFDAVGYGGNRSIPEDGLVKAAHEIRHRVFSVYKGSKDPFFIRHQDLVKSTQMVREGFPGGPPKARRGADDAGEAKPKVPTRPHLADLQRAGLDDNRDGRDVTADDFISTFGFRGVEFGNWLPDDERQTVLNHAYDAFHDLAETMGVPPASMSLDGSLAVAFGSRGSGKAAAHYEPGRRVVNVTRMSGAGSLAHEFAHALDHASGEANRDDVGRGDVRSGTGWDGKPTRRQAHLTNLPKAEADAWDRVMSTMLQRPRTRGEAFDAARDRFTHVARQLDMVKSDPKLTALNRAWLRKTEATVLPGLRRRMEYCVSDDASDFGSEVSEYAKEASKLGGKTGTYWSRPTELFARAFECYVFDTLTARGARSDYLVHGVEWDRYAGPPWKGNPYPVGEERRRIGEAIKHLLEEVSLRLGKSMDEDDVLLAELNRF